MDERENILRSYRSLRDFADELDDFEDFDIVSCLNKKLYRTNEDYVVLVECLYRKGVRGNQWAMAMAEEFGFGPVN
jgi:hypothetical protein